MAAGLLVAVGLAALVVAGCDRGNSGSGGGSSGGSSGPLKLAFVTNNVSEFWKIARAGVQKYEKEGKVHVEVIMPTNGTVDEQNQILENLVSQGYDGVAVSVIAPKDQVQALNRVAEKAKLITFDSDAADANRLLYIGTNNYEAGKLLGGEIVKLLPQGGEIAVFVGTFAADNAAQRFKGIEDVVTAKGIKIIERREDQANPETARSNVEAVLNARPEVDAVVGLWSYNGPAIAAALEATGRKGKVKAAVFDEDDGTLTGIEAGTINVTVVQRPFEMGYQSSKWLHDLAAKGQEAAAAIPANKQVDTGAEVINAENVKAFRDKLAEMKK
jgi:ribose transport system substrate-binding protein